MQPHPGPALPGPSPLSQQGSAPFLLQDISSVWHYWHPWIVTRGAAKHLKQPQMSTADSGGRDEGRGSPQGHIQVARDGQCHPGSWEVMGPRIGVLTPGGPVLPEEEAVGCFWTNRQNQASQRGRRDLTAATPPRPPLLLLPVSEASPQLEAEPWSPPLHSPGPAAGSILPVRLPACVATQGRPS